MHSARRHGVLTLCGEGRIRTCVGVGPTSDQVPVRPLRVPLHCCLRRFCCLVFAERAGFEPAWALARPQIRSPFGLFGYLSIVVYVGFAVWFFAERAGFEPAWALARPQIRSPFGLFGYLSIVVFAGPVV